MATLMRSLDWAQTPLGPIAQWPSSLQHAASICIGSRHPIELWWGPRFVRIYNDGYRPILGATKHPQFLGRPGIECWPEIWDVIAPMLERVRTTGEATWSEDMPLMVTRNGYLEETYFTFSYSPVRDESGQVGGIFCACSETTGHVFNDSRLRTLRSLAERSVGARTAEEAARDLIQTLAEDTTNVPFALLYLVEGDQAVLAAATGPGEGSAAAPKAISLSAPPGNGWRLAEAARTGVPLVEEELAARFGSLPGGKWPETPSAAVVIPVAGADKGRTQAFLVVGANPRRRLDADYLGFFRLLSDHAAGLISSVRAYEDLGSAHALLAARAAQQAMVAEVGTALAKADTMDALLQHSAESLQRHTGAAFARIWTLNFETQTLELVASAGQYTHLDGPHARVPVGKFKIGRIAQNKAPHLTNDVQHDPQVGDPAWAAREKMVAFAGYPLIVGGQVVGVMALFHRQQMLQETFDGLASMADMIATGIQRRRAEAAMAEYASREALARKDAELQRQRLLGVFAQAPAAIAVTRGPEHRFETANALYRELTGRDPTGKTIREGFPELEGQGIYELLDGVLRTGEAFLGQEVPVRLRRGGGALEDGFFNFVYQPLREADGSIGGIMVLAVDVSEQVRSRHALEALARELKVSNSELDQFAYVASHDLKAPLRGIANLSSWVEEDLGEGAPQKVREHLALMRGRVHRMEALIDGILDYSRAGRVKHPPEPVELNRLLTEVTELLSPKAGARVEVGAGMPVLTTEKVPLQQVFMNLVGNALKHARRSDPLVRVEVKPERNLYRFSVIDNGQGIAPEFHERIWGIFQTLESRDKVEGTGIGLSVVKKIVESRGGRAWVESSPGQGAQFHFTWPTQQIGPS